MKIVLNNLNVLVSLKFVICGFTEDFTVQLVNSDGASHQGRVEIFYRGQWGTICGDRWDLADAAVVCKQLGFTGAQDFDDTAQYGEGTGKIWLDNLECTGSESSLNDCGHNGWGIHDCEHSHDVGVVCLDPSQSGKNRCGGIVVRGSVS